MKDVTHYSHFLKDRSLDNIVESVYQLKAKFFSDRSSNILIFCHQRLEVDALASELRHRNSQSENFNKIFHIHGDFNQNERNQVVSNFQLGGGNVLIGTSAMARGMDLPKVDLVIHLGTRQHSPQDYIHRL